MVVPDALVEPVKVLFAAYIALDADRAVPDLGGRLVQAALPAPGEIHVRAFRREALRCCQANTVAAAGNGNDLVLESRHHASFR